MHLERGLRGWRANVAWLIKDDPATARFGETFHQFYRRTVPAQFKSAWRLEKKRLGDELLFGKLANPQYLDYSKDILNSGRHLLAVINDVLDLSRIDLAILACTKYVVGHSDVMLGSVTVTEPQVSVNCGVSNVHGAVPCTVLLVVPTVTTGGTVTTFGFELRSGDGLIGAQVELDDVAAREGALRLRVAVDDRGADRDAPRPDDALGRLVHGGDARVLAPSIPYEALAEGT